MRFAPPLLNGFLPKRLSPAIAVIAASAFSLGALAVSANATRVGILAGTWTITEVTYPQPMTYLMARNIAPRGLVTIDRDGSVHGEYYYLTALIAPRGLRGNTFFIHETASNERYKARLSSASILDVVGPNGAYFKLTRRANVSAP